MTWRGGPIAAVLVVALLSASCGGSDAAADVSQFAITGNPEVASLLGTPLTDADVEAEQKAIVERSEALTALCMAEAGFDYIPVPPAIAVSEADEDIASFGVADEFFGAYDDEYEPPSANPNLAILESFSDDEVDAYAIALNGAGASFDIRFDSVETVQETVSDGADPNSGCRAQAAADALAETDRNPVLIDDYQLLRDGLIRTDQRLIRARVDWATCMAEAGFPYNDTAGVLIDLSREASDVLAELQDRGIELRVGETPPPDAIALIDGVYEREDAALAADMTCSEPLNKVRAEVIENVDAVFLDRNS